MDIKFVRKNGANINNNDDYVPFKYAYSNIDGYTNGFTYSVNGNILHINANSRIVVQGVESMIETGGIDIEFDIVNEKRYNLVYLSVNMATQTSSILTKYSTIADGVYQNLLYEDITGAYGRGVAQIPLIYLETENGVISNVRKDVKRIPFTEDIKVKNAEESDKAQISYFSITQKNEDESEKIATTQFVKNLIRLNTLKLLLKPNSNNVSISNIENYDILTHFSFTISATYNGTTYRKNTGAIPKTSLIVVSENDLGYDTEWGYGTSTSGTNQNACIRIYNNQFQVNVSSKTGSTEYKILEIYGYQEV